MYEIVFIRGKWFVAHAQQNELLSVRPVGDNVLPQLTPEEYRSVCRDIGVKNEARR